MPIYSTKMQGRAKPILVRADSAAKAVAQLVTAKALTTDQLEEAITSGEKVWAEGDDLPEDDKPAGALDQGDGGTSGAAVNKADDAE